MEIGKSVIFTNRAGVKMTITRISELQFMMKGIDTSFMRTSTDNEGKLVMFDPPGGPYTTAEAGHQPGTNLGYYDQSWKHFVVERIEFQGDKPDALLTCKYTKPIVWEKIK
jgi:hypothetical protein